MQEKTAPFQALRKAADMSQEEKEDLARPDGRRNRKKKKRRGLTSLLEILYKQVNCRKRSCSEGEKGKSTLGASLEPYQREKKKRGRVKKTELRKRIELVNEKRLIRRRGLGETTSGKGGREGGA